MQNIQTLRIGRISSVNYKDGTAKVKYEDRDDDTTLELSFMAWEYWMPEIDDQVLVGHLANGSVEGFILGPVWHKDHRPYAYGKHYYRHELHNTQNRAAIIYDGDENLLKFRAGTIAFDDYDCGTLITVGDIRSRLAALERKVAALGG